MGYISSFLKYLFDSNPGSSFTYYTHLIILAAVLIIGSILFSNIYKKRKKHDFAFKRLFKSASSRFLTLGIILLVLVAIRYEHIPYFSMRIWLYILLIIILYFIYKYLKIYKVEYPKEKQNAKIIKKSVEKEENKYLPHKNKKKRK